MFKEHSCGVVLPLCCEAGTRLRERLSELTTSRPAEISVIQKAAGRNSVEAEMLQAAVLWLLNLKSTSTRKKAAQLAQRKNICR